MLEAIFLMSIFKNKVCKAGLKIILHVEWYRSLQVWRMEGPFATNLMIKNIHLKKLCTRVSFVLIVYNKGMCFL